MEEKQVEALVRQVLGELLGELLGGGVKKIPVSALSVSEAHGLDTGKEGDRVYTRDLFTLEESPRLGAGIMEIHNSRFPWHLSYDEMDYVLEGRLDIEEHGHITSALPGELLYLPKGSDIHFAAQGDCRFLYFVYPANWQEQ
jgi:ethanolamine utilization protein EutQ